MQITIISNNEVTIKCLHYKHIIATILVEWNILGLFLTKYVGREVPNESDKKSI